MLALPFEESLFTYPTLDYTIQMVEQQDLSEKGKELLPRTDERNRDQECNCRKGTSE